MCVCPEMQAAIASGTEHVLNSISKLDHVRNISADLTPGRAIVDAMSTIGPQVARQFMRFNNQTVADKVPLEMLHLIDPHWYISQFF